MLYSNTMRKKLVVLLLILLVLVSLAGGYVVGGLQAYARYQQSSAANQEHCGGQDPVHICVRTPLDVFSAYYPSYTVNHVPLFTVTYSSSSSLTLLISVNIQGFSQVETHTVSASSHTQTTTFTPPLLNSTILNKLTAENNTSVRVHVTDTAGHEYYLNDGPLQLHSRWLMQWVAGNRLRIAAWVTPGNTAVAHLVTLASKHLAIQPSPAPKAMIGYNKATPRAVRDQVDAIFDALRLDYHMRYVQASVPYSGPGDTSADQQFIKLPAEVLQQQSGMCVELTLLLASAVESIGLHTEIVIIPGHAFLGVAVKSDDSQFEYWDAVQVNNGVAGDSANIAANNEYQQSAKQLVDTILISNARQQGIGPMF
ncbi:MAG TPA: hypothetical protein VFN35_16385 [Ktedonobacteraceae bacterium]|nr:hypothetical protein [Ktedonobacteraceae bacterium]